MSGVADTTVVLPPSAETVEAAGVVAVEIAEIEAARDVRLTEISAETTEALAETQSETHEDDVEWLRGRLTGFETSLATLAGELSVLRQQQEIMRQEAERLTETVVTLAAVTVLTPLTPEASSEVPVEMSRDPMGKKGGAGDPEAALQGPESEATSETSVAAPVRRRGWLR